MVNVGVGIFAGIRVAEESGVEVAVGGSVGTVLVGVAVNRMGISVLVGEAQPSSTAIKTSARKILLRFVVSRRGNSVINFIRNNCQHGGTLSGI